MESCRAVRIWGLGQHRRHNPACRFAVCPSTVAASSFTSLRPTERNTALEKELEIALTQREVPVDDLAGVERSKRSAASGAPVRSSSGLVHAQREGRWPAIAGHGNEPR